MTSRIPHEESRSFHDHVERQPGWTIAEVLRDFCMAALQIGPAGAGLGGLTGA